jgi:hypothetical protein
MINGTLNFMILLVIIYIAMSVSCPRTVEGFESYFFANSDCHDCEKCQFDPKVEEIKKKISDWMDARIAPWTGHLDCLNHKKKNIMDKIRLCRGGSSYTIDKEFMYICTKDKKTGEYYDDVMLMHVTLHEIAHVICDEIGHTKKFDDIFTSFMEEAHSPTCDNQYQIYDKHAKLVDDYCGVGPDDVYDV